MGKLLTIGMPSYNNYVDVWFTVQALRMYHDLTDCEILVVDNFGDKDLKAWIDGNVPGMVRYELQTEKRGTAPAKQTVFERAEGEFVICIDSHILIEQGAIEKLKTWIRENRGCKDLIHGPMQFDCLGLYVDRMTSKWETSMWGVWGENLMKLPDEPSEILMMGMGLFGCFKDAWLGFNPLFKGFGGEEGYIHEKYRKFGRKVISLPWLVWVHKFHNTENSTAYPNVIEERIYNYLLGFQELGLDLMPIYQHFGPRAIAQAVQQCGGGR